MTRIEIHQSERPACWVWRVWNRGRETDFGVCATEQEAREAAETAAALAERRFQGSLYRPDEGRMP